ncbi:MAG: type II toxin-antitoxin system RelE/ParE family toxin [Terriglobales bacterium]
MQVIFTPAARAELVGAQDWYENRRPGLGARFREEVEVVVLRLRENPHQFPAVFRDVHRARLRKFPYSLFYRIEIEVLEVIACFHGSRDPQRWERRI